MIKKVLGIVVVGTLGLATAGIAGMLGGAVMATVLIKEHEQQEHVYVHKENEEDEESK